jgi:cob(I)alamin adenosyltransferase
MKIYTKTGDTGETSLLQGVRVPKYDDKIELNGTIDEMQAVLVLALEFEPPNKIAEDFKIILEQLLSLSSDVATIISDNNDKISIKRISEEDVKFIENLIDKYNEELPTLKSFIIPGGNKCSSFVNFARTICRRAERIAAKILKKDNLNIHIISYLNRLSDYLFTAMRYCNK